MNHTDYYIYFYLRDDGSPYYVGRGRRHRAFSKHVRSNKVDLKPKDRNNIVFIETGLNKLESIEKEKFYIAKYGRKEFGGILLNIREGGDDFADWTPEMRKALAIRQTGRKLSEETKRKMSISAKGKKKSKESILKSIATRRQNGGYDISEETRKLMSESRKGLYSGGKNPAAKPVNVFTKNKKEFIGTWTNARQACAELNLGNSWKHVPDCCRGLRKTVKGYVFEYAISQSPDINNCSS